MFRNGFNATRRSLLTIVHPRSLPLKKDLPSSSFVCISCQYRSLSTKHVKRGKGLKADTFLGAIKRLEAHVQHIERNYLDKIRQQEALKELPDHEITDEEQDQVYAALMAPGTPSAFLPAPSTPLEQLPPQVVLRLGEGSKMLVAQERGDWGLLLTELELNGGLQNMTTSEVNKMVSLIAIDQRAELSKRLLEMIRNYGVEPNALTYDLMMLAHAAVGNPEEVKRLFTDMREQGLKPTVYTYAHLLKAHSQQSDVQSATLAIQEMHSLSIIPNLVIYTTLIQTCINRNQLETAWQIFNLIKLKSTATAPDTETYTLMIHACAIKGEVERALDLYTDMTTRRHLTPTYETYHALIHACALRKDYFTYTWRFATEMQMQGMVVGRLYLNTLVQACGRTGELTRARMLVRHMMASARSGSDVYPDEITFQNLMRAYATYRAPVRKSKGGGKRGVVPSEPEFVNAGARRLEKRVEGEEVEEELPFLEKSVLTNYKDVLLEARQVLLWIRRERPHFISTQLMNAYLNICHNQGGPGGFREVKKTYNRYFTSELEALEEEPPTGASNPPVKSEETVNDETAEDDEEDPEPAVPPPPPSPNPPEYHNPESTPYPKPPRNIHTFTITLQSAYKSRDLRFARQVYADREQYKRTSSYLRMFPEEKRKHDFYAERIMIDLLAACEFLGEAVKRLKENLERFEWKEEDLKTLYVRAVQMEDWRTVELCNKVIGREENRY